MKLSRMLLIALAGLIVAAATGANAQTTKPVRPTDNWRARQRRISCAPQKLFRGDSLRLRMNAPHGGDLAVIDPGGRFFFLSFWQPDKTSPLQPLLDWEEFKGKREAVFDTSRLKATLWVAGRDEHEPVFTRTGWYRVRVSENLETDDGTPVSECRVYYVNARRR